MRTFKCDFGGVSCECKVPFKLEDFKKPEVTWTGKPTKRTLRPYIAWMNSINELLANEWGKKLMHVYLVAHNKTETWIYEPGKPPKRL